MLAMLSWACLMLRVRVRMPNDFPVHPPLAIVDDDDETYLRPGSLTSVAMPQDNSTELSSQIAQKGPKGPKRPKRPNGRVRMREIRGFFDRE